ncbi:MAG: hypothetical protein NTW87_03280 [Planctomycetota bacterium]|nr:hypothetical protein [Planctomycetota bacterium]
MTAARRVGRALMWCPLVVLMMAICGPAYGAEAGDLGIRAFSKVPPPGTHPRVLLSPEDVEAWRRNIALTAKGKEFLGKRYRSDLVEELAKLDAAVSEEALSKQFEKVGWEFSDLLYATMDVMYHSDDKATKEKVCRAVANFARVVIARSKFDKRWGKVQDNCQGVPGLKGIPGGLEQIGIRGGETFALSYDFLFNDMTVEQREVCRKALALGTKDLITWGMGYAPGRCVSNWVSYHGALPLMFWAIEGEEGFDKERLQMFLAALQNWFDACLYPGGGGNEDGYMANTGLREGTMAMIAWARRGNDLFRHPGYQAYWRWMVQSLVPAPSGAQGVPYACNSASPYESMPTLSLWAMPNHPLANYYFYRFKGRDYKGGKSWQYGDICTLLACDWKDDAATPLDPAKLGLPLTDYFPQLGLMTIRSDWSDEALSLNFYVRQDAWQNRHESADRGRFVLCGLGRQWIGGWWNNYQGSQVQSLVHIDGVGQLPKVPSGNMIARYDSPLFAAGCMDIKRCYDWQWENRFGSPGSGWEPENNSFADLGWTWPDLATPKTLFGADDPKFPAYGFQGVNFWRKPANPVQFAFRTCAMTRGAHPYVVVIDDIRKDDKEHRYASYLEITPDIELAKAPGGGFLLSSPDAGSASPAPGSLFLRVLSPADVQVATEDYQVPGYGGKPEKRRRVVVRSTTVQPDFRLFFTALRKGETPPVIAVDAQAGSASIEWPNQKDTLVFTRAKEGFSQITLKRDGKTLFGGLADVTIHPSAPVKAPR